MIRAAVLALLALAGAASAATLPANPATLKAALSQAKGGDTIALSAGRYDGLALWGLSFSPAITITSADPARPAVLTNFTMGNDRGLMLGGLELLAVAPGYFVFQISGSSDIHLDHLNVHGSLDGNPQNDTQGVSISGSTNVSITNSEFQQFRTALGINTSSGITVSGNHIHDVEATGMVLAAVTGVMITGNSIHDFFPAPGDHDDAIQFMTKGQPTPSSGIEVAWNLIHRGKGQATQGIFFRDQTEVTPYAGVSIHDNLIVGTGYGGIYANGLKGGSISGNALLSFPGPTMVTPLVIELSDGVSVVGNLASAIGSDPASTTNTPLGVNTITQPVTDGGAAMLRAWSAVRPLMAPLISPFLPPAPVDPRDAMITALRAQVAANEAVLAKVRAAVTP